MFAFFLLISAVANLIIGVIYGWKVSDGGVKKLAKLLAGSLILGTALFVVNCLIALVLEVLKGHASKLTTSNLIELIKLPNPILGALIVLGFIGMLIGAFIKWLATKL